ncbi:MAG TPA: hypothetical protein VH479_14090 [Acidimicrobiales bacterium]
MPETDAAPGSDADRRRFEARWPVALAVSAFIVLTLVLRAFVPRRETFGPHWLVPAAEIVLLVVIVAAHPATATERARLRRLSIALTVLLAASALLSTGILVYELVTGSAVTSSADSLLASGAIVWVGNALIFGLLYWQLDSGGPVARHRAERPFPDFAFTQQLNPELATPGWRPRYVDYLVLGFTTSTAFSPTDVMPMAAWAKLAMALQSLISLTVIGLVIARAVNVFS